MTQSTKTSRMFNNQFVGRSDTHQRAITKTFFRRASHKADRASAKATLRTA